MINVKMTKEQLDLLSEHLQGYETQESEELVYHFVQGVIALSKEPKNNEIVL